MTDTITPWDERKLNYALEYPREDAMQAEIVQLRAALAKPVREPLTDDVIFEIACGAADEMWPDIGEVGWTKDDTKFYGIFCKKIERAHGIGEEK